MKVLVIDEARYIMLTGYGCLARNYIKELNKYKDIELMIQGGGENNWQDIDNQELLRSLPKHSGEDYDIGLQIMPGGWVKKFKGTNIAYTMNAISKLKPDWIKALNKMDLIIVPSNYDKLMFANNGINPPIEIVHQSADYDTYTPSEKPPIKPFVFLNVGTFNFRKGQDILLKAFKLAFNNDPNFKLIFKTGEGNFKKKFTQLIAEVGNDPQCVILDDTLASAKEMVKLYNSVHCLVNPSRGEGWNMPVMEAMACELPTIATNATAMLDYMTEENSYPVHAKPTTLSEYPVYWWTSGWLGGYGDIKNGCLYEINPVDLADAMRKVVGNYAVATLKGKQARKDIIEKWSWESAGKKLHDIIVNYETNTITK